MEDRRKHRGDNHRRSQSRKPPRGSWQRTVPSWEKEFCKVVGSLDWETLLQMKKFMHLYSDVMNWNDSAGQEAFCNAKKRYWAEINGLSCDTPPPDPDLYIDKINWDSEIEPELSPDLECKSMMPNSEDGHEPVVIFGNSLMPNQAFSPTGWGDEEENMEVPVNQYPASCGFGDPLMPNQAFSPMGWGADAENLEVPVSHSMANYGDPWQQNWGYSLNNGAAAAWPGYSNDTWHCTDASGPAGFMPWGGNWNYDCGWSYANNHFNYTGPDIKAKEGKQGLWNDSNITVANAGKYVPNYGTPRAQVKDQHRNRMKRNDRGQRKAPPWGEQSAIDKRSASRQWSSINSCRPVGHHSAITVGRTWNQ